MKPKRVALSAAFGLLVAAAAFACATVNGRGPLATEPKGSAPTAPSATAKAVGQDGGLEPLLEAESTSLAGLGFVPAERQNLVLDDRGERTEGSLAVAQGVFPAFVSDSCDRLVVVSGEAIRARVAVGGIDRAKDEQPRAVASFGPVCGRARDSLAVEVRGSKGTNVAIGLYSLKNSGQR